MSLYLCRKMLARSPGGGNSPGRGAWERAAGEGDGGGCSSCGTSCPFFVYNSCK